MPWVSPPVCYLCSKVHSVNDMSVIQLTVPIKGVGTKNFCSHHPGIKEEKERQENASTKEKAELARIALSSPDALNYMAKTFSEINKLEIEVLLKELRDNVVPKF